MAKNPRFDLLALAILIATAAGVRVVLGYRPFPSVDDFTYIPLGLAGLDPNLFPRDDILHGYSNFLPLWPRIIWFFNRTMGLPEGLFLLTLVLTILTVLALRQLLRTLGGSDFFLPLVMALAVTVNLQGLGRGAFEGVLGSQFHMQWLALLLVLAAYNAFVREKWIGAGIGLGLACWAHPVVAFHGALCVVVASLVVGKKGVREAVRAGFVAALVSLPVSVPLLREAFSSRGADIPVDSDFIQDTVLFRAPHHYEIEGLRFLIPLLLGLLAVAAIPRIVRRQGHVPRRFLGLLLGQALLLLAAFILHGPPLDSAPPVSWFWVYALDLPRTTPLFLALAAVAVAGALPTPKEAFTPGNSRKLVDWFFSFSVILCFTYILLVNLRPDPWMYLLLAIMAASYLGARKGVRSPSLVATYLLFAAVATTAFLQDLEIKAFPDPEAATLFSWVLGETPNDALFIIPPGMESFRLETQRSVYVDFKSVAPTDPEIMAAWRKRLEQVANPDARARERAGGWAGVYWWDVSYAKRNPSDRIALLLNETGADFFVKDLLFAQLPPHLPDAEPGRGNPTSDRDSEIEIAFENGRYLVYRRRPGE